MINNNMASLVNKYMFGQATTSQVPTYWYIGILKDKIPTSDLEGIISGREVTGDGYSRVRIPNTADYFQVVDSNVVLSYVTNKNDITFPNIISGSDQTIVGFFLSKVAVDGTAYIWGNLNKSKTLRVNTHVVVKAGALRFAISNTEGSSITTQGLVVNDQGILSSSVNVSTSGVLF